MNLLSLSKIAENIVQLKSASLHLIQQLLNLAKWSLG